jgi:hypothetical protein
MSFKAERMLKLPAIIAGVAVGDGAIVGGCTGILVCVAVGLVVSVGIGVGVRLFVGDTGRTAFVVAVGCVVAGSIFPRSGLQAVTMIMKKKTTTKDRVIFCSLF